MRNTVLSYRTGATVALRPVDRADVTVLVDNSVDVFLAPSDIAKRPYRAWDPANGIMRAEHGLSLLLAVEVDGRRSRIVYDTGLGRDTALHNLDVLSARVGDVRAIVLSHGHVDHYSGLEGLARRVGARGLPLVLHPHARRDRRIVFPDGETLEMPAPSLADLEADGVEVVEERGPSVLIDGAVLVTGEVDRETPFEQGFPLQYARSGETWEPDFAVWDDQAVVVNVRDRGLLVLTGCGHAGVVNICRMARRMTGVERIAGIVGGFHLTGPLFEPRAEATVDALAALAPDFIAPGHCTGWRATHAIARRMPEAFIQSSVGTTFGLVGAAVPAASA